MRDHFRREAKWMMFLPVAVIIALLAAVCLPLLWK
jgi:hypothetical protein